MRSLIPNVRYALRLLRKSPTFTLTAVLCLGLGIAANTTMFGVFNALLWKPLAVAQPGSLVRIYARGPAERHLYQGFSYPEYLDYRTQNAALSGLVATSGAQAAFRAPATGEAAVRVFIETVSDNYFEVLGLRAQLGRVPAMRVRPDGSPSADPEVVLSHRFWQRRLGAAPDIVGKAIWLSGAPFTVVGVMPRAFNGTMATTLFAPDLWLPLGAAGLIDGTTATRGQDRTNRALSLLGRLKPGVGVAEAQAACSTVASRLARSYPQSNDGVDAVVFRETDTHPEVYGARALNMVAVLFLALSALVLAVACANLANLMLARSAARRKEIALRLAMGATRLQLVQQLLTEALLLSVAAAGVGLGLGLAAARAISAVRLPTDIPVALDVVIDLRVLSFTVAIALVAGVGFGLLPAVGATRPDLVPALKGADVLTGARRPRVRAASVLMVAQVAFSLVLLVAAGLFWRSIAGTERVDPGMAIPNRTLVSFSPSMLRYDAARTASFYRTLLDRVAHSPETECASLASWVPLGFNADERTYVIRGSETRPGKGAKRSWVNVVTPKYLDTVGVRIRTGRAFNDQDTFESPAVAIVNETLARQAWPGRDPIGRQLRADAPDAPWLTVVGVVADGKYRTLTERPSPYLLRPLAQVPASDLTLVVKTGRDHAGALAAVRRAVLAIDPNMPLLDAKTMDQQMAKVRFVPQAMTALSAPVAGLAVLIAAIGLYGVVACSVSRRTREFGIRLAVGASSRCVVWQVMRRAMGTVAVGLGVGGAAALGLARLAKGVLVGVAPTDPTVFAGAVGLLLAVALLAGYLPARRASRIDPLVALRQE